MSDGSVWVTMKMYLRDIMSVLVNNEQFETQENTISTQRKESPVSVKSTEISGEGEIKYGGNADEIYSGVVIDASGLNISPAMSPKIYDADGKEIYGSAAVERDFALRHGIVGYAKDVKKATKNDRVKGKPLIIKAKSSDNSVDLTISAKDAELLKALDRTQTFLREARVIIVVG
jgi:hypothetical protein